MRTTSQATLDRLWALCREHGVGEDGAPRRALQTTPFLPDNPLEQTRCYMLESLFTGLYTLEPAIALRSYVQAHGYVGVMGARGEHQPAHIQDALRELQCRVEDYFLRGEVG